MTSSNIQTNSSSSGISSLYTIQSCILTDIEAVNRVIQNSLHSDVSLVNQVAHYIINSGGKRLRPILVLLSAGLFGEIKPHHHELAAVVEFIHTATLLHDDVVDQSAKRRGQNTANALFGNSASVLVGDFVYSRAFQMMVVIKNMRVMEVLSNATNVIAEGEVLQLLNIHNADVTNEAYLQVIQYKTAKLFEAAMQLGAIISQANAPDEAALSQYGLRIGTAFQLIDDVLDLTGNETEIGKTLGDDLREGKPTLPLLFAMKNGTAKETAAIKHAIEFGGLDDLQVVLNVVIRTGALDYVRTMAQREAQDAMAAIAHFKDSVYKQALLALAEFSIHRNY